MGKLVNKIILIICMLLALTSCSSLLAKKYPEAEGLFPYYSVDQGYYGLIDNKGKVVLPIEYTYVGSVYDEMKNNTVSAISPEDRLYTVVKTFTSDDSNEEEGIFFGINKMALISSTGEILTDFIFSDIFIDNEKLVGISSENPKEIYWINKNDGALEEITDSKLLLKYGKKYINNESLEFLETKTGVDVPVNGFNSVDEIEDGKYWGNYSENISSQSIYRLFNKDGTYATEEQFEWGYRLTDDIICAVDYSKGGNFSGYLFKNDGTRFSDQEYVNIYSSINNILLMTKNNIEIYDCDWTLVKTIPRKKEDSALLYTVGNYDVLVYDDGQDLTIENLDTKNIVVLDDMADSIIQEVAADNGPYIVEKEDTKLVQLIDRDKNVLLEGNFMYFQSGYVIFYRYYERNYKLHILYGLYDLGGNQVLPTEYSEIRVLDGNAALVTRGDYSGIMDLNGKWIYKKSIFSTLD